MIALLDVNVLIALLHLQHVHNEPPHHWFAQHSSAGWASCPLTQNVAQLIVGFPRYSNSPGATAAVMLLLIGLLSKPHYQFWADAFPWFATTATRGDQVLAHGRFTDVHLLALAVHHQGC